MATTGRTTGRKLTIGQEKFVLTYAATNSLKEAAKQCGLSDNQGYRLSQTKKFRDRLDVVRRELFNATLEDLRLSVKQAIATLVRHFDSETTPPSVQIRAAQIYLEFALQVHKIADIEKAIELAEEKVKLLHESVGPNAT